MDQQQLQDVASEAAEKTGKMATDAASQAQTRVQDALDQGKTMFQDMQGRAGETVEKASTLAREAAKTGGQAMARAGEVIQGVGNQASQVASNLYEQGAQAREQVGRYVPEQPLTALLIAAAIGYGLAYLIHRSSRPLSKQ